jgi:thiol-disulfide isomerase/thioredoxin
MNKKFETSTFATFVVVISVLLIAGYFAYQAVSENSVKKIETSSAGAAFIATEGNSGYTNIEGEPVSLKDYLGNVLIVNSWASWSPQSAQELVKFADVAELFAENEVVVLAINRAEPKSTAQAFLKSINMAGTVVLILDPEDNYYTNIAGFAMPETLFYDIEGNIIYHKRGSLDTNEIIEHTKAAIAASE